MSEFTSEVVQEEMPEEYQALFDLSLSKKKKKSKKKVRVFPGKM